MFIITHAPLLFGHFNKSVGKYTWLGGCNPASSRVESVAIQLPCLLIC